MHSGIHYCDGGEMKNECETSCTHSLLVVRVHKVLVPSPEVRHTLELGHGQDGDVPSVANQLFQVGHSPSFHIIRCCSPCGELGKLKLTEVCVHDARTLTVNKTEQISYLEEEAHSDFR